MKTATEYQAEVDSHLEETLERFRGIGVVPDDEMVENVDRIMEQLDVTDEEAVRRLVRGSVRFGMSTTGMAAVIGGVTPEAAMMFGMSPSDLGEQAVATYAVDFAVGKQLAELLVEVFGAVTGTELPRTEDGNVDVPEFLSVRYEADLPSDPSDIARAIVDAFEAKATPQAA